MPTPAPTGAGPDPSDAAANVPVNIARPNWQCPHCLTKFQEDLETATACAAAGPAPDVESGIPVLVLHNGTNVLGLTEVGKVRRVTDGDGDPRHEIEVLVQSKQVAPEAVASAPVARDGLRILTDQQVRSHNHRDRELDSLSAVTSFLLKTNSYSQIHVQGMTTWAGERSAGTGRHDRVWLTAPNPEQRHALDVVTGGLLTKIVEADEEKLLVASKSSFAPRESHRTRWIDAPLPQHYVGTEAGLMLADAHGAPNHVWALRWINAHLDTVVAWQVRALRAWAAGDPGSGPFPLSIHMKVPHSMPKNPGKRRWAVMEPYGDTYERVRDAILDELLVDAPTNPIPGVDDVTTTVHNQGPTTEGATDE